jgi:hypothetical protein
VKDITVPVPDEEDDFARRQRLQDEVLASIDRFRAGDRLTRNAVHDRAEIRRCRNEPPS